MWDIGNCAELMWLDQIVISNLQNRKRWIFNETMRKNLSSKRHKQSWVLFGIIGRKESIDCMLSSCVREYVCFVYVSVSSKHIVDVCVVSLHIGLCMCISLRLHTVCSCCVVFSLFSRADSHWDYYCHVRSVYLRFSVSLLFLIQLPISVTVSYFCFHSASNTTLSDTVEASHTYMCRACWIFWFC